MSTKSNTALQESLGQFEKRLMTPVVPGEEVAWAQAVHVSPNVFLPHLRNTIDVDHAALMEEILEQDMEMVDRVDLLKKSDIRNLTHCMKFGTKLCSLSVEKESTSNEPRFVIALETMKHEGVGLVSAVREQEQALETWFLEAFHRERGTLD